MNQAPSSFGDFYMTWMPKLTAYLRAQTSDGRWAEDIAQDAFLAARENWDELMLSEKPGSWLFHVANRMQRRWLTKAREQCTSLDEMVGWSPAAEPTTPVHDGARDQYLDLVAAIRTLPRRQREVITLHCVIELPLTEVADILGITASSAKTHLTRARERLTELLDHRNARASGARGLT
jgi:RNA polymerase sigma-70 factor (ECF subfamily)